MLDVVLATFSDLATPMGIECVVFAANFGRKNAVRLSLDYRPYVHINFEDTRYRR